MRKFDVFLDVLYNISVTRQETVTAGLEAMMNRQSNKITALYCRIGDPCGDMDGQMCIRDRFFYEVYNSENSNTASDRSVTFASGAAAFTIESGQVIRLFLPKGTSITVSETPTNGYTVSYKNGNTAVADGKEENFPADTDAADIQVRCV